MSQLFLSIFVAKRDINFIKSNVVSIFSVTSIMEI